MWTYQKSKDERLQKEYRRNRTRQSISYQVSQQRSLRQKQSKQPDTALCLVQRGIFAETKNRL
jgi:hypothetical protein